MIVENYRELGRNRNIDINYTNNTKADTAYVADYMEKIIGNLMSNAVKYNREGGLVNGK